MFKNVESVALHDICYVFSVGDTQIAAVCNTPNTISIIGNKTQISVSINTILCF